MIDRVRELMRETGMSEEAIAGSFERFAFVPPDTLPPIAAVAGGPDGSLWVQRTVPIERMTATPVLDALLAGGPDWDVFDRQGGFLGAVTLPLGFTLKRIRGYAVYGVQTDEFDAQRVMRLCHPTAVTLLFQNALLRKDVAPPPLTRQFSRPTTGCDRRTSRCTGAQSSLTDAKGSAS
jgi:hypothetical protein